MKKNKKTAYFSRTDARGENGRNKKVAVIKTMGSLLKGVADNDDRIRPDTLKSWLSENPLEISKHKVALIFSPIPMTRKEKFLK